MFDPLATPAQLVSNVSILTLVVCGGIFLVVASLLAYAVIRFRRRPSDDSSEPAQIYGSNQIEIAWTVIPILIVFVLSMATARITSAVQDHAIPKDALQVTVTGHQWWWEFRYTDAAMNFVTANELHVPVSTAEKPAVTLLTLKSADVVHSFWVPQLAGKTDLIPNRVNTMWMDPKEIGTYPGNCAAYCGTQHAFMLLRVVVESQEDFARWVEQQKQPAAVPEDPVVKANQTAFLTSACIACHTVRGTRSPGISGPDLTHVASRETIGSGATTNTPEHMRAWIANSHQFKPGNLMPPMKMDAAKLDQISAYLGTLR
ncbi:MAG TPA: cytochrome c oxidase subunit II [Bryobacteraceae bacterium]|nr:cytochrome c oxidase subunit II [Bryobacteraceae bacterium]